MLPCAIALVFNPTKTHILLHKRQDVPVWVLPGGGIDPNETPEEATIREVEEETGLKVRIERPVAEYTPLNRLARPTFTFECRVEEGELTLGEETADVGFFALEALPSSLFPLHRHWIDAAVRPANEVVREPITQVTYGKLAWEVCRHPWWILRYFYTRFTRNSQ